MTALTRDYVSGPPTDIRDCLNAFFDTSELKGMFVILALTVYGGHICRTYGQCLFRENYFSLLF